MSEEVLVKDSLIAGKGVFAAHAISKGTSILTLDDSNEITDPETISDEHKEHLDYLANGKVVLMQSPEVYINHSCDPNAYVKTIGGKRTLIAIRNITSGEEITYDYAINGDYEWGVPCNCGSANCRKIISPNFWELPQERQFEYLPYLDNWFVEKYMDKVQALRAKNLHN
jgi:SET domain-containing protein